MKVNSSIKRIDFRLQLVVDKLSEPLLPLQKLAARLPRFNWPELY